MTKRSSYSLETFIEGHLARNGSHAKIARALLVEADKLATGETEDDRRTYFTDELHAFALGMCAAGMSSAKVIAELQAQAERVGGIAMTCPHCIAAADAERAIEDVKESD
jgi:hypothetical protein